MFFDLLLKILRSHFLGINKSYISRPNLRGDIELKDVQFSYKDQNQQTLKDINLKIKEGEKIAILGKIGSGKSTLLKLIMNLYEPTSGSVLIDGLDTRQIDPTDLRHAIGSVPQEPFLFMGTIKDNLTIGEQYVSDEELLRVSKIAGLDEFLGKHEAGYDLLVGERGEGLSGGERQSVTLARALISDPNIIMLDEPTNSMDRQTEKSFINRLQNIIDELARGNGKVIPTDKIQTVQSLDGGIISEIFIKEGDIVKFDAPLMKIDTTRFQATLEESKQEYLSLLALKARLEIESMIDIDKNLPELKFDGKVLTDTSR
uniref:ABC transporter domain-containing protein n=1 Tax=Hucho hucho TaxID=62062 RepID=A0A4W5L7Q7_9TELE